MKKALIYGDVHFPFQDQRVLNLLYKFTRDFKPDIIIDNGDLMDFTTISKFTKDPLDMHTVEDELKLARKHFTKMRKMTKKMVYVEGNHESRMSKYISDNVGELAHLTDGSDRVLTLQHLLGLHDLDIEFVPMIGREAYYQIGSYPILIGHFNKVSKHSCYTAKALLDDKGISLIQSHVHRCGTHYRTNHIGDLVAVENGCLCDLHPKYVRHPNWQHGFSVIYLDDNGHRFQIYNINITDYKFYFGSKKYTG